jgi:phosphatidylethanolamine-binding protein (PEBP) family uncharacterized protein
MRPSVLCLLAAGLLAGCGAGSTTSTPSVPVSPGPVLTKRASLSSGDVALVSGVPVTAASYAHWLAVEKALGTPGSAPHRALAFLITSLWVRAEAAARHISLSAAEVRRRYAQLVQQGFPKPGTLKRYLARSGESEADLLARIEVQLLTASIAAQVTAGKRAAQRSGLLIAFQSSFHAHWKRLTTCRAGYVMEDCSQYNGRPETPSATSSHGTTSSGAPGKSGSAGRAGNPPSTSPGQVQPPPRGFSISSAAFARGGAIPARYTCAGAGISPPLSWQNVPVKAAELVLFVIDASSSGSTGAIRWILAGIDPGSTGVAAGKLPPGAIVGTNTAGKAAYSPICPAHGNTDTIQIVIYALKKTIPLNPGFRPNLAEREYGSAKLLMGSAVDPALSRRG